MKHNYETSSWYRWALPAAKLRQANGIDYISDALIHSAPEMFDCRRVPEDFVANTGEVAIEDAKNTNTKIFLPYGECYFEWHHYAIWACHLEISGEPPAMVEFVPFDNLGETDVEFFERYHWTSAFARINNGVPFECAGESEEETRERTKEFMTITNSRADERLNELDKFGLEFAAAMLVGVVTLLNEKLLLHTIEPDPAPRLTARRRKDGRTPLTGPRHILQVNVPAVRRVSKRPTGTHESPALHWRRGHWRTLHRWSEFESRCWVTKCLVGDPDKGFVSKSYRLIHETPMIAP